MSLEVISIGLLSQLFQNLKNNPIKKSITKEFGLPDPKILVSWMHAFTDIRNLCAHHCRIWDRRFVTAPIIPYNATYPFIDTKPYPNKLYVVLCCIQYIYKIICHDDIFAHNLKDLLSNHTTHIDLKEMGFTLNWDEEELWN